MISRRYYDLISNIVKESDLFVTREYLTMELIEFRCSTVIFERVWGISEISILACPHDRYVLLNERNHDCRSISQDAWVRE